MSFEEEFDRIVRQKTEEAKFPFDEKNWEKVSGQLDAERKAAPGRSYKKIYVAGLLLLLGSAGVIAFNALTPATQPALAGNATLATLKASPAPALQLPENTTQPTTKTQGSKPATDVIPASGGQKLTLSLNATASASVSSTKVAGLSSAPANKQPVSQNGASAVAAENTVDARTREAAKNMDAGNSTIADGDNETISAAIEEKVPVAAALAPAAAQSNAPVPEEKEGPVVNEPAPAVLIPAEALQFEPLTPVAFNAQGREKEITPLPFALYGFYNDDYFKRKAKLHFMNVEAGAAYLPGWDVKGGKDGKGLDWFCGINYGLYLSGKISLGIGAQLYNIGHISQPFYNASKTDFDFGSTSSHTVITAQSVYYAAIPVRIAYAINRQSQLGAGFNLGFLASSDNKVQIYQLSDNSRVTDRTMKSTGAYKGIANTSMLLSIFYKTQVAKRMAVNAECFYGLTDLFENNHTIKNNENPMGLRLSLQYTLFDK